MVKLPGSGLSRQDRVAGPDKWTNQPVQPYQGPLKDNGDSVQSLIRTDNADPRRRVNNDGVIKGAPAHQTGSSGAANVSSQGGGPASSGSVGQRV